MVGLTKIWTMPRLLRGLSEFGVTTFWTELNCEENKTRGPQPTVGTLQFEWTIRVLLFLDDG